MFATREKEGNTVSNVTFTIITKLILGGICPYSPDTATHTLLRTEKTSPELSTAIQ